MMLVLAGLVPTLRARADVRLGKIIGDNMVLQRDHELPIWGKADPGEKVTVRLADKEASGTAGADGRWLVRLPKFPAGGPHELVVTGKNKIILKNVLVGEVWICSGQSNMEWPMTQVDNPKMEIDSADYPKIRLFHARHKKSDREVDDVVGKWEACSPTSVPNFSAVAYFFGRHLHKELNAPVGLIECAWGGTPAEHWTPSASFQADSALSQTSGHPHSAKVMKTPSVLYNGMIAPLIPHAIRGAIWYQGESNVPMAKQYHRLFSAMITGWRKQWGQGDFPFLFVQLAPWNYAGINWPREGCPLVREAQLRTLSLANTGMVVTMDIGDVDDIHPRNKQEVGRRLGLAARAIAHGEPIVHSGPIYKTMKIEKDKAVLHFDHVHGGLVAKGGDLAWFEIAGKDRAFVDAKATIHGDKVVVQSDKVKQPVAVRFAWSDVALPNLFNQAGLPASPFRTDDWD
jgi:sialate O-acetylesterase